MVLCLLLLALGGRAQSEEEGTQRTIPGVPARFDVPAGAKALDMPAPPPGEWVERFEVSGHEVLVRAFPAGGGAQVEALILQAVQRELRSRGSATVALGERTLEKRFGHPTASAAFTGVFGGTARKGAAVLFRLPPKWVVLGFVLQTGETFDAAAASRVLDTLIPTEAKLYTPRFRDEDAARAKLWTGHGETAGEEPITGADVDALVFCIEAGLERRLSLMHRASLRACLVQELATQTDAQGREGMRAGTTALALTRNETPETRLASLAALGHRIRGALRDQALKRHTPALCALAAEARALRAGLEHAEVSGSDLRAHAERAAFLASLRLGAPVMTSGFAAAHKTYWNEVIQTPDAPERLALEGAGLAWASLRAAWERATPDQRLAVRLQACALLSDDPDAWLAIEDTRALWRAHEAHPAVWTTLQDRAIRVPEDAWSKIRALLPESVGAWSGLE